MHDVAMRRRLAALVIAALLAMAGAALATTYFAADDRVVIYNPNTGNFLALVGTDKDDVIHDDYAGYDGNDSEIYT
jgi:uncharacterized protein involved in exopolysaccharide biosynthesis